MSGADVLRPQRPVRPTLHAMCTQPDLRAGYSAFESTRPKSVRQNTDDQPHAIRRAIPRPTPNRSLSCSSPDAPCTPISRTRSPTGSTRTSSMRRSISSSKSAATPAPRSQLPTKNGTGSSNGAPPRRSVQEDREALAPCTLYGTTSSESWQQLPSNLPPRGALLASGYLTPPDSPSSPLLSGSTMFQFGADVGGFSLEASPAASIKTVRPPRLERAVTTSIGEVLKSRTNDSHAKQGSRISAKHRSSTSPNLQASFYAAPVRLSPPKSPPSLLPDTRPSSPLWPWSSKSKNSPKINYTEELFGPIIPASSFSQPVTPMPKVSRSASMRSDCAVDTDEAFAEGEMVNTSSSSSGSGLSGHSCDSRSSFTEWKAYLRELHERQPPHFKSDTVSI